MITILCAGSRGDIQPYIPLALELKKLGHEVRIATGKSFGDFIQSFGIGFAPVNADASSVAKDDPVIKAALKSNNPLRLLQSFRKMKEFTILMQEDFYTACQGSDLIIYHPGAAIGYFAAQELGVPSVLATPFPLNKTKEYPSVILYGKVKSNPLINRLSYSLLQSGLWMVSKSAVKTFWNRKFRRIPAHFGCPFELQRAQKLPAISACSNFVFSRPSDWNSSIHQMGYWFLDDEATFIPPKELVEFLKSGEPPVYVGFGSVSDFFDTQKSEKITKTVIEALQKAGKRGVLAAGSSIAKGIVNLPDSIYMLKSIPHSWLFPRICAVVHHGGAGTTAAGFKAGVSTVITPIGMDQYAWGQRAFELGVGAKPVPMNKLTVDNLAAAITFALRPEIVSNAKRLAEKIATENGAAAAARVISACLE